MDELTPEDEYSLNLRERLMVEPYGGERFERRLRVQHRHLGESGSLNCDVCRLIRSVDALRHALEIERGGQ